MTDPDPLFPLPDVTPAPTAQSQGKPRLETANRQQVEMRYAALDDLLPDDHRARLVWALVEDYDLSRFYARIQAVEGEAGRPAIDPRLLVTVWLYATLEGVTSGREVNQLCQEHLAYQWLLGGVTVNYHTLTDFRTACAAELDALLTQSVAALLHEGVVTLDKTAQDGLRLRASAGTSSFHRQPTLEACLQQAEAVLAQQTAEAAATDSKARSAQQRHAQEKVARVKRALEEVGKVAAKKAQDTHSQRKARPARASTTDPEARVMKMADSGFQPAYNAQLAIDMDSRLIVGVAVSNEADPQQLQPMLEQIQQRYACTPHEHYVDGNFRSVSGIEYLHAQGTTLFMPLRVSTQPGARPPADPLPSDGPAVRAWKVRMATAEAKQKYPQRAATIEWANALARLRGLSQLRVRGLRKVRAVVLWFALAHNLLQTITLRAQRAAASPAAA